ncbi:hypothetical protein [Runella slithyformis]|uniref:Uncharacterized protein n=1 Tax=Runella slithyformis (strain ATCC 29530 / DSM 19594 / LMG 11500 / NCIMB 11436 / LSU 4) TaxID=761193 RepID=A0A7U3ZRR1_RUNSL|nr:hypothetical protein [Runella slithyformis]AEI52167.1 hypothetical protein Runsl_5871 [Runella slithyformis DSM 19594]
MSKIGLNANIYQLTGKYLNLINDLIVEIKTTPNTIDQKKKEELIAFFSKVIDDDTMDPQIQLMTIIIEREFWKKGKLANMTVFIRSLINGLNEKNVTIETAQKLETIVEAFDTEHTVAFDRIKGT